MALGVNEEIFQIENDCRSDLISKREYKLGHLAPTDADFQTIFSLLRLLTDYIVTHRISFHGAIKFSNHGNKEKYPPPHFTWSFKFFGFFFSLVIYRCRGFNLLGEKKQMMRISNLRSLTPYLKMKICSRRRFDSTCSSSSSFENWKCSSCSSTSTVQTTSSRCKTSPTTKTG